MRGKVSDWLAPDGMVYQNWGGLPSCPDYLNDLNAMHEAQRRLSDAQWDNDCDLLGGSLLICAHATATQRAEAFLKTLNLWKQ